MKKKQIINFTVTIIVICLVFIFSNFFSDLNNNIYKGFKGINGEQTPDTNIVLIHISSNDIMNLGDWPLKRSYYALLIDNLSKLEVKKIGLEIFLSEKKSSLDVYSKVLSNSIINSGKVVLSSLAEEIIFGDDKYSTTQFVYPGLKNNNELINTGHINFLETDGIIIPSQITNGDNTEYSFSNILVDSTALNSNVKINFISSWKKFKNYSLLDFFEMVEQKEDLATFNDKIIIVGVSDPQIAKTIKTTFDSELPGVGLHAFAVDNLLQNRSINYQYLMTSKYFFILTLLIIAGLILKLKWQIFFGLLLTIITYSLYSIYNIEFYYSIFIFPLVALIVTSFIHKLAESQEQIHNIIKESKSLKNDIISRELKLEKLKNELSTKSFAAGEGLQLKIIDLESEIKYLKSELAEDSEIFSLDDEIKNFEGIVYKSNKMDKIIEIIKKVAPQDASVLVMGESGSGKELVANAIHNLSRRNGNNFVAVNCAALPDNLLESELFGHVKGAFTGAISDKIGRFQEAHNGTLFLDEIGETTENFQVKLLRVLQTGDIQKVGSSKTENVDVRIVAATNKNLHELVKSKEFREDLYYRLNVINIELPSLNERSDDIEVLVNHFVKKEGEEFAISKAVMKKLVENEWKGNIRELESTIKRAIIFARSEDRDIIKLSDLPDELSKIAKDDLENLILESLREKDFSHSSINETARELGGLNRTIISENFRGIFFRYFTENDFDIENTVIQISAKKEIKVNEKVKSKLTKLLSNVETDVKKQSGKSFQEIKSLLNSKYKNLPQKYHIYLDLIIKNILKNA